MAPRLTPMERLRAAGVTPDRSLGQNFLIDPNILDLTERMALLSGEDVVLEVGPGLGVLTERLLARCRLVHCIELDRRLASMLEGEFGADPAFRLYQADAMRFALGGLEPPPGKFVANLPYSVAAPLVMRSLEELPSVRLWCLMLQKEIADRLFARVGAANYGAVSVMVQLLCRRLEARNVAASVFYPPPRIRSTLISFRRREEEGYAELNFPQNFKKVKTVVQASFGHRRKTLVNSLCEAGGREADGAELLPPLSQLSVAERKRLVAGHLNEMGLAAGARAQQLEPAQFARLAQRLWEEAADQ